MKYRHTLRMNVQGRLLQCAYVLKSGYDIHHDECCGEPTQVFRGEDGKLDRHNLCRKHKELPSDDE